MDLELSSLGHVTNALALSKQKSLLQAIGVDLQARWKGGDFNRRFLGGLNPLPWVVVGAAGTRRKQIHNIELSSFSTGGPNFFLQLIRFHLQCDLPGLAFLR